MFWIYWEYTNDGPFNAGLVGPIESKEEVMRELNTVIANAASDGQSYSLQWRVIEGQEVTGDFIQQGKYRRNK